MDNQVRAHAEALADLLPRLARTLNPTHTLNPETDLPIGQLRMCSVLLEGPRTVSAISAEMGVSASAATQLADRLEHSGLLERTPDEVDRRVRSLRLTSKGVELMRARRQSRVNRIEAALQGLAAHERQAALDCLRALIKAAETARRQEP